MSMQRFCHHCGKQVIAGSKFCSSCGTNLLSLASTPTPATPTPAPRETFSPFVAQGDDEEGDSYLDKIHHLDIKQNALQVEIVGDRIQGETVGTAVRAGITMGGPPTNDDYKRNQPFANVDRKAIEAEFAREAGALQPQTRNHVLRNET